MLYLLTIFALAGVSISTLAVLFSVAVGGDTPFFLRIAGGFVFAFLILAYFHVKNTETPYEK